MRQRPLFQVSTLIIVVDGIQLEPDEDEAATRDPAIGPLQHE